MKNMVFVLLGMVFITCSEEDMSDSKTPVSTVAEGDPEIVLVNNGMTTWNVMTVDGEGIKKGGEANNQTLTMEVGLRYSFFNRGGASHPLDFRNAEGEILFSQDFNVGKYENDPDVNFVFDFNDDLAAFTLTEELAAELATYNCSFHESMVGSILIQ